MVSRGWSGYLQNLFGLPTAIFGEQSVVNVGAILIVAVLGTVAAIGVKESARVTNTLVVVKVAIRLFVIAGILTAAAVVFSTCTTDLRSAGSS